MPLLDGWVLLEYSDLGARNAYLLKMIVECDLYAGITNDALRASYARQGYSYTTTSTETEWELAVAARLHSVWVAHMRNVGQRRDPNHRCRIGVVGGCRVVPLEASVFLRPEHGDQAHFCHAWCADRENTQLHDPARRVIRVHDMFGCPSELTYHLCNRGCTADKVVHEMAVATCSISGFAFETAAEVNFKLLQTMSKRGERHSRRAKRVAPAGTLVKAAGAIDSTGRVLSVAVDRSVTGNDSRFLSVLSRYHGIGPGNTRFYEPEEYNKAYWLILYLCFSSVRRRIETDRMEQNIKRVLTEGSAYVQSCASNGVPVLLGVLSTILADNQKQRVANFFRCVDRYSEKAWRRWACCLALEILDFRMGMLYATYTAGARLTYFLDIQRVVLAYMTMASLAVTCAAIPSSKVLTLLRADTPAILAVMDSLPDWLKSKRPYSSSHITSLLHTMRLVCDDDKYHSAYARAIRWSSEEILSATNDPSHEDIQKYFCDMRARIVDARSFTNPD